MHKDKIRRQKIWWLLNNTSLTHLGPSLPVAAHATISILRPKWGNPSQSSWWQCSLDCCISNFISDLIFFLFWRLVWIKRHLKSLLRESFTTYLIIFPTLFPPNSPCGATFFYYEEENEWMPLRIFFFFFCPISQLMLLNFPVRECRWLRFLLLLR